MNPLKFVSKYAVRTYPTFILWLLLAIPLSFLWVIFGPALRGALESVQTVLSLLGSLGEGLSVIRSEIAPLFTPSGWREARDDWGR